MELEEKRRKSFVFNCDWLEILQDFPAEVRLEVYEAAIRYAASGRLSELKPLAKMAFSFIRKEIDYNNSRYDERLSGNNTPRKRGNPNLRKGEANPYYRPKEKENEAAKDNSEIIRDNSEIIRDNSDNSEIIRDNYIYINDNDNDNVNENEDDNDSVISPKVEIISPDGDTSPGKKESIDYGALMDTYNAALGDVLPRVKVMTDKRKKAVRTCVRQFGKTAVMEMFQTVRDSPFLLGHNSHQWTASFDWLFTPGNFIKVLEKQYYGKNADIHQQAEDLRNLAAAMLRGEVGHDD